MEKKKIRISKKCKKEKSRWLLKKKIIWIKWRIKAKSLGEKSKSWNCRKLKMQET